MALRFFFFFPFLDVDGTKSGSSTVGSTVTFPGTNDFSVAVSGPLSLTASAVTAIDSAGWLAFTVGLAGCALGDTAAGLRLVFADIAVLFWVPLAETLSTLGGAELAELVRTLVAAATGEVRVRVRRYVTFDRSSESCLSARLRA